MTIQTRTPGTAVGIIDARAGGEARTGPAVFGRATRASVVDGNSFAISMCQTYFLIPEAMVPQFGHNLVERDQMI